MKARCTNPNNIGWHLYGGRGVTMCERWEKFENFFEDMGDRPQGKTLDRYPDKDGNYEPGNCRWATVKEQGRNTRSSKLNAQKVAEIRAARGIVTGPALAKKYGVTKVTISKVQLYRTWN